VNFVIESLIQDFPAMHKNMLLVKVESSN